MSQEEQVEIVRRLIDLGEEARETGTFTVPTDLVSLDVEFDLSRRVFNPEIYRGVEGWVTMTQQLREVWEEWHVMPERIVAAGERVVSIEKVRGRGRGSGLETEGLYASIWTFTDGKVTRVEVGLDPAEALKAVGLE